MTATPAVPQHSVDALRAWLAEAVAPHVRTPPDGLDPALPLAEYGLDSVSALAVAAEIEDHLGVELDDNALWEHPSIGELAAHLAGELARTARA